MTIWQTMAERADAYVLGLMDDAERTRVEEEMQANGDLATAVGEARDRFIELDLAGPSSPVSDGLWKKIEQQLEATGPQPVMRPSVPPQASNDNRLDRWKRIALSSAAAAMLFFGISLYALFRQGEPQVIAILMDSAGQPVATIEDFGNDSAKVTPLVDLAVPTDRSLQLWTLPTRDMGPVSLGILDGWQTSTVTGPALPGPIEEQLYEITLEPLGGSPTGRPTGPILGKGFAKAPRL
ncbi:anti-sigma factor [Rhizobium sp. AG855]|uniref:anti-sigma factor n=1 Tax=Rhizobium sp. AG855 TaxID=2183898 RepID=UPI000E75A48E|nr:anti-sigma factor [Rhizobium sp. AG855]RKE86154.1 anti-sigma-K factor RskA [Rhizobium sp. AG855]